VSTQGETTTFPDSGREGSGTFFWSRAWLFVLSAGLAAGLASWLAGEAVLGWYAGPEMLQAMAPEERLAAVAAKQAAETKNVALALSLFGGTLGLGLGAAGGLIRRSVATAWRVGGIGLVGGTVAGALVTVLLMPIFFHVFSQNPLSQDLTIPILLHAGLWLPLGTVAGLAFGVGLGPGPGGRPIVVLTLLGGLVGAVVGAAVYEIVGALAFPLALTTHPLSLTWGSRLFARLLIALSIAAGAVAFGASHRVNARDSVAVGAVA